MSEPINVDDLVMVVRWPCCGKYLGIVGRVDRFVAPGGTDGHCGHCRAYLGKMPGAEMDYRTAPLEYLKRIPPLEELEGQPTQEDIKEPA